MQIPMGVHSKSNPHTVTTKYLAAESMGRTQSSGSRVHKVTDGVSLDISDMVTDNYQSMAQGRAAEDVKQKAQSMDVELQRDYMTVMSNSMSEEDFAQMCKDGFNPSDTDVETMVTVLDRIKTTLAMAGVEVAGYNDDIDPEILKEITGSESRARMLADAFKQADVSINASNLEDGLKAMERLKELDGVGEQTYQYMVKNQMAPTIDNFYMAQHSAGEQISHRNAGYYRSDVDGYLDRRADDISWDNLQSQVTETIQNAGMEVNEETLHAAENMIKEGIPFTEDSLSAYFELKSIQFPIDPEVAAKAVAAALSGGDKAMDADLSNTQSMAAKAVEIYEKTMEINDEDVITAVTKGTVINLKNLFRANISKNSDVDSNTPDYEQRLLHAQKCLQEIRLSMTAESNLRMLRNGFAVELKPLGEVVKQLQEEEQRRAGIMFQATDTDVLTESNTLFNESLKVKEELKSLPISMVGELSTKDRLTLRMAYNIGVSISERYKRSGESYEALMTTPDYSLGDSIRKAFRNTDAILEDMGLESTEENRRAIRILGYNQMEITPEAVEKVGSADQRLRNLISRMTPASTLKWIREGINPLDSDFTELENSLNDEKAENKDYAKFLYHLEQKDSITPEEKESFIGIYRLLRQIEKSDGAAVGGVVNTGTELTFSNLLTQIRTRKNIGQDIIADDSFQGVDSITLNGKTITEQVFTAFTEAYTQAGVEYQEEYDTVKRAFTVSDRALMDLLAVQESVTPANLLAAEQLRRGMKGTFKRVFSSKTDEVSKDDMGEKVDFGGIMDAFTDKDSAQATYSELLHTAEMLLDKQEAEATSYVDLKAITTAHKQISLAATYARNERYEIPVQIGEQFQILQVRFVHDDFAGSEILFNTQTEELGNVFARISATKESVSGYLMYDAASGKNKAEAVAKTLNGVTIQAVFADTMINTDELKKKDVRQSETGNEKVSSESLYRIARDLAVQIFSS